MIKIGLAKYNGQSEASYLENEDTDDGIYLVVRKGKNSHHKGWKCSYALSEF